MLRTAVVASLIAFVSGDTHLALARSQCVLSYKSIPTPNCRDIVELGRCFADNAISAQPPTNEQRILAEHELIMAQKEFSKNGIECVTNDDHDAYSAPKIAAEANGDLSLDVHEKHEVHVFRFKREIVSLYNVTEQIKVVDAKCATKAAAQQAISDVASGLATTNATLTATVNTFATTSHASLATLESGIAASITAVDTLVTEKLANLNQVMEDTTASLRSGVDADIQALMTEVATQLEEYALLPQVFVNDTHNPKYSRFYELIRVEAPESGQHKDRVFYKIDFNPTNRGYFDHEYREMIRACNQLNDDLEDQVCPNDPSRTDGIDRKLRLACNHDDCDYGASDNGVKLAGAYLSHSGNKDQASAGLSTEFLAGAVMYRSSHGSLLRHDGVENSHRWVSDRRDSNEKADFTICTAWDDSHKEDGPLAGCQ